VGRQESWLKWLSRVQLHSTDLHHGLKLKLQGASLRMRFWLVFTDFWLVFTRVRHFWLVFTHVRQFLTRVHSCSQIFDSCSLVFINFWLVFINFWLVFTRVVSCSLVFWLVWSFRTDRKTSTRVCKTCRFLLSNMSHVTVETFCFHVIISMFDTPNMTFQT
jgi:hypothetical protein